MKKKIIIAIIAVALVGIGIFLWFSFHNESDYDTLFAQFGTYFDSLGYSVSDITDTEEHAYKLLRLTAQVSESGEDYGWVRAERCESIAVAKQLFQAFKDNKNADFKITTATVDGIQYVTMKDADSTYCICRLGSFIITCWDFDEQFPNVQNTMVDFVNSIA